jgi:hypothetical protein
MCVWANGDEAPSSDQIKEAVDGKKYAQAKEWRDSIKRDVRGDLSTISGVLARTLDDVFRSHFIKSASKSHVTVSDAFMGKGEDARNDWASYCIDVIDAVRKAQSKGGLPRGFTARATLDLIWMPSDSQPIPFLTESVIDAWTSVLKIVTDSTTEVSTSVFIIMVRGSIYIDARDIDQTDVDSFVYYPRIVMLRSAAPV